MHFMPLVALFFKVLQGCMTHEKNVFVIIIFGKSLASEIFKVIPYF